MFLVYEPLQISKNVIDLKSIPQMQSVLRL